MRTTAARRFALLASLAVATPLAPGQGLPERPRDPWVFRSTLDGRPRMVTIALDRDLWVAYDATWCGLYAAWKGDVDFDGSASPGEPRAPPSTPALRGARDLEGPDGAVWWIARDGEAVAAKPVWRGYAFDGGQVQLRYELVHPDGARIQVEETPEFVLPEKLYEDPASAAPWLHAGMVGFRRTFAASGVPEGTQVFLSLRAEVEGGYLIERLLDLVEEDERTPDGRTRRRMSGRLPLDSQASTNEIIFFFERQAQLPDDKKP